MDLKYIFSLNPEDLNDDEKDDLWTFITWFDCDSEEINPEKFKTIFKLSQEILKYKGEQVETLLHELEEMAVKQGEEEARRQEEETELKSVRSRKSSSIEYENLEQKYLTIKAKHKKLLKTNEKQEAEIEKLNKKLTTLQQENRRLQNELQSMPQDIGSESDVSETIKDQQKELVHTIHSKNQQISDLLKDIEEVESENYLLREKLSKVRDQLADATKEITAITDSLKQKDEVIKEQAETYNKLNQDIDQIKVEFNKLQNTKDLLEEEFKNFKIITKEKMYQLEITCKERDEEITELRGKLKEPSLNSSISSLPKDEPETSHLNVLQRLLAERENQLTDVKTQLQIATKEIEESTEIIKILKSDKEALQKKLDELEVSSKDFKTQLKTVYERCRNLQDEVTFAEKNATEKTEELQQILSKIRDNGQVDLVVNLQEIDNLKSTNRLQEKHITRLVKDCNKLQEACEILEQENLLLREKLGMPEDEEILIKDFSTKEKKRKREMEILRSKLRKLEETNITLRTDIHKLNQANALLTNQEQRYGYKHYKTKTENYQILKEENKAVVEENEALRKGLHEILDSINTKKIVSTSEIKSETFEKLLRALDVKHISGWYHPAMRLQAELHNLEGANTELREQLRDTKIELRKYQSETDSQSIFQSPRDQVDVAQETDRSEQILTEELNQELTYLENVREDNVEEILNNLFKEIQESEKYKDVECTNIKLKKSQQNLLQLFTNIFEEKKSLEEKIKHLENNINELADKMEIHKKKVEILEIESSEDTIKKIDEIIGENVKLKRQILHMENEIKNNTAKAEMIYQDVSTAETQYIKTINDLQRKNKALENNLVILKNHNNMSVSGEKFKETEKNLENITLKYRELASDIKKQEEQKLLELKMLQESQKALESNTAELKSKLTEALFQLALQNVQQYDDKSEKLAQKLSECEVSELTERQRANHTNNLYELVKEQLNKSEERFQEYSKYNEELLKKNLILQEQLKEVEDKMRDYVDQNAHKELQSENNKLLSENEKLQIIINKLEEQRTLEQKNFNYQKSWNDQKEQELLNLKHQIVDLISISDEKVIISQLNNDILQCRQSQNYYRNKYKEALNELNLFREKLQHCEEQIKDEGIKFDNLETVLNEKIKNLQNVIQAQRLQYLGCMPLSSEEAFLNTLRTINKEKHNTFLTLNQTKILEHKVSILKEQLEVELDFVKKHRYVITEENKEERKNIMNWLQEKKNLQINELRYKRQSEFKEQQLKHFTDRIKIQDDQILRLEEELFRWQNQFDEFNDQKAISPIQTAKLVSKPSSPPLAPKKVTTKSIEVQTIEFEAPITTSLSSVVEPSSTLNQDIANANQELQVKNQIIDQLKSKIKELEMKISLFRQQIGDKQSQITFYERHILELQNKKEEVHTNGAGGDNLGVGLESINTDNEELIALKTSIKSVQDTLKLKEEEIIRYQTLLKVDRDKHSLAAASLQEELKRIQRLLSEEKEKNLKLEESFTQSIPQRAAVEHYISQVHALEQHTSELHTKISSLEAQLQSCRQEAVRWRGLANDRLTAMEELRKSLDEQHKNELMVYKNDSEKLKELNNDEINTLRQLLSKQGINFSGRLDLDLQKLVTSKDEKINELSTKLRQVKITESKSDPETTPKMLDLESSAEVLKKENDILKKRCEQFLMKEKLAKDEIRELKSQLLRKPMTGRSDKSEKSIKDQLQKKVTTLENEIESLKQSLADQISINETHRIQASEDFQKWKKMKHWQQSAEKLKNKLKDKDSEFEKLHQTNVGYRMLIERLEREKHNLENRIKTLKSNTVNVVNTKELELMQIENMKLQSDLQAVNSKLEMQQHHSGGLGAAMMQEKLESQERKIAVLELAAKGTVEVRAELERLQGTVANLQKSNLMLEAENLDLKLDVEKSHKEMPHLQRQIQHLESYVEVLKTENSRQEVQTSVDKVPQTISESKKVSELERTIFILKRVVEKLQAENKRLQNGKRPISDRAISADKTKRENIRLKEQYSEAIKKIDHLEQELSKSRLKNIQMFKKPEDDKLLSLSDELSSIKEQLEQKSSLLDKVKFLLHRAASKEKVLLQEIAELKNQKEAVVSPIPEESEESSSSNI